MKQFYVLKIICLVATCKKMITLTSIKKFQWNYVCGQNFFFFDTIKQNKVKEQGVRSILIAEGNFDSIVRK